MAVSPSLPQAEFGFATWRSFPERLVGFVAHRHYWDPVHLQWSYSSRWTNEYSVVLTEAMFYHRSVWAASSSIYCNFVQRLPLPPSHPPSPSLPPTLPSPSRYYGYLLTHTLSPTIRSIADNSQHCLNLAVNFIVAQAIRQPPVKVTHKKELSNQALETTSFVQKQTLDRVACLNMLVNVYGYVPLLTSSVRMDPVLFKDNVSMLRKEYRRLESL